MRDNVGRIINDGYCGGFFGREFDLYGSTIIAEGPEWIVIQKTNGLFEFGTFQDWDWNRHEDGTLSGGLSNLTCLPDAQRQKMIDEWCGY